MKVKAYKLGEIFENYDYLRKPLSSMERETFKGEYPYYGAQGIIDYVREYRCDGEYMLIAEDGENLMSRTQPIAIIANGKYWVNNHAHIVRTNNLANLYYTCYALNHLDITGYVTGSAQPKLSQGNLNRIKMFFPSPEIQKTIVNYLCLYDNLIEANNKRIKVLEQMAENLHKEWFVRFRFPGHENVEFENGIPKGWKTRRFSSVANILSGGTPKTEYEEYYGGQIPFYTPKDSADSFFVFDTITKLTEDGLRHCNSQLYPQNTIMITARGTVGNLNLLAVPMAMNQSCYALNSDTISSQYFLFFLIKREIQKLKKMASGGVFDTIIVNTFDHIKVLLPTDELINKFDFIVSSIMKEVYSLSKQNINLIKQRDLLLPRLMSGKLEVKM